MRSKFPRWSNDETQVSTHFRFGENWQSFQREIDETKISEAVRGLAKLLPPNDLLGKSFMDIGCGSGLSMLAALRMGASRVVGTDIDAGSVSSARRLLTRFAPGKDWHVSEQSVLDMDEAAFGTFDVVYSWGVLHHTGNIWRALAKSAVFVKPGGLLVLALYHKTPLCWFWRREKRFYTHARGWEQRAIRLGYKGIYLLRLLALGQNPRQYIAQYHSSRGMDWEHDIHDWLGGYPYESTLPDEVVPRLQAAGLSVEKILENCAGCKGLLGSGCDEYVARRAF